MIRGSIALVWLARRDEADPSIPTMRLDAGVPLLAAKRTTDGFLLAEGAVARPGIYVYRNADGSMRRELVRADVLAAAAPTLGRVPVTLNHPDDPSVTPENVQRWGVGDVGDEVTLHDDGYVRVKMAVRRKDAIDAIDGGKVQLSPGYDVTLDETPGVDAVFGRYDAVQTARRYNHLAIVDVARGGAGCALRADALEEAPAEAAAELDATAKALAAILVVLGVATPQEAREKLDAEWMELVAKRDALNGILGILQCETAEAARAKLSVPAVAMDSAAGLAWHVRRVALDALAVAHRVDGAALSDAALRKAIVLAAHPSARADADDAYYDAALAFLPAHGDAYAGLRFDATQTPSAPHAENPYLTALRTPRS